VSESRGTTRDVRYQRVCSAHIEIDFYCEDLCVSVAFVVASFAQKMASAFASPFASVFGAAPARAPSAFGGAKSALGGNVGPKAPPGALPKPSPVTLPSAVMEPFDRSMSSSSFVAVSPMTPAQNALDQSKSFSVSFSRGSEDVSAAEAPEATPEAIRAFFKSAPLQSQTPKSSAFGGRGSAAAPSGGFGTPSENSRPSVSWTPTKQVPSAAPSLFARAAPASTAATTPLAEAASPIPEDEPKIAKPLPMAFGGHGLFPQPAATPPVLLTVGKGGSMPLAQQQTPRPAAPRAFAFNTQANVPSQTVAHTPSAFSGAPAAPNAFSKSHVAFAAPNATSAAPAGSVFGKSSAAPFWTAAASTSAREEKDDNAADDEQSDFRPGQRHVRSRDSFEQDEEFAVAPRSRQQPRAEPHHHQPPSGPSSSKSTPHYKAPTLPHSSSTNRPASYSVQASPRVTATVSSVETEHDHSLAARMFGMMVTGVAQGSWGTVAAVSEKFATTYGTAGSDLQGLLPAFIRVVDRAAQQERQQLKTAVLSKSFAVAMCFLAHSTQLELDVLSNKPADWKDKLANAHYSIGVAVKALADVTRAAAGVTQAPASERAAVFALVPPVLTKYRLIVARCTAGDVHIDAGLHKGACTSMFRDVQRLAMAAGGDGLRTCASVPVELAVAAARIVAELVLSEGIGFLADQAAFIGAFNTRFAGETQTRIILLYRAGVAHLANMSLEGAQQYFSEALVLSVDNESRLAILEALVITKLTMGEVPVPEVFDHYAMPELEDIALSMRAANLRMFDGAIATHGKWLLSRGYLFSVAAARMMVMLHMIIRFFATRQNTRITMLELRAYYAGQFEESLDLAASVVTPLLLRGRIRGYLHGDTLMVSRKEPFPGLPGDRVSVSYSPRGATIAPPDTPRTEPMHSSAGRVPLAPLVL
jgi:hypothetical protein